MIVQIVFDQNGFLMFALMTDYSKLEKNLFTKLLTPHSSIYKFYYSEGNVMVTKVGIIVGILAALAAAEGSNRFGSFVSAFGGSDGGFYTMFLIISIVSAGVLLAHFFNKKNSILNYVMVALNAISVILLLGAPMLGVVVQIFIGMIATAACLLVVQFTYTEADE